MRGWAGALVLAFGTAGFGQTTAEVFAKAVDALTRADYRTAEAGFQEVLRSRPRDVDSLLNLGVVYSRTGRLEESVGAYRRVLEFSPANKTALLNLGLAEMKRERFGAAMPAFEELVRADRRSLPARDAQLIFAVCDGYLKQHAGGDERRRVDAFLASVDPAAANLVLCRMHFIDEQLEEAERYCRRTIELNRGFPGAHLQLARVLAGLHREDAEVELAAAIRDKPEDAESLYDIGTVLLDSGRTREAVGYLERARTADPDFWGTYFLLGKARMQMGQTQEAVTALRRAAELNQTSFSLYYELGRALRAAGQSEEAERAMQKVRELMAEQVDADVRALRKK